MADRRVAITGIGVVCPAGIGIRRLWEALLAAKSCIRTISLFDAGKFPCRVGGELADFSARGYVPKDYRKAVKVMARDIEIAVAAADLAFRDGGIVTRAAEGQKKMSVEPGRLGCNVGAGLICSDLDELGSAVNTAVADGKFDIRAWGSSGMNNLTPLWLLKYLPNMLACHVTIIHGAQGPSNTITCGEASGHLSVGEAARLIQRGGAEVVIAGGAESKLNPMGLLRQSLLGRLCANGPAAQEACRPFDAAHAGTIVGEGGGLLILEEMSRAEARGTRIYAEVAGFGEACDPGGIDVKVPTAGSLDLAVQKALADAGVDAKDIGLVATHGTGVPAEDDLEAAVWAKALGQAAETIPAVAITGAIGSLFAGAGGVELAVAAMALHAQTVPPTVNFARPADGCRLSLSAQPRNAGIEYAVSGAFGTGGQSGACVLKRYAK